MVGGVLLGMVVWGLVFTDGAGAAVTHSLLPELSGKLAEGVPSGCAGSPEPPCASGGLSGASALATDGNDLWVADTAGGKSRVDRFNAETGAFVGPQLDEEGGVRGLTGALVVGHAFSGKQVYVEAVGPTVAVYDGTTGKLAGVWGGAHSASGAFGEELSLAVDGSGSGSDPNVGDVFVAGRSFLRSEENVVDVFNPTEAAKAGVEPPKPVAELKGTCEKPEEALPCEGSALIPFRFPQRVAVSPLNGDVLVYDGFQAACAAGEEECAFDVFGPVSGSPGVYDFLFAIKEAKGVPFRQISGLAADGNGDIYVAQGPSFNATPNVVDQFDAKGGYLGRLTGTQSGAFAEVTSMAVDPSSHDVFVGDSGTSLPVKAFGKSIVIPDVSTRAATEAHATGATLHGAVKLDEAGSAECFFDYGTSTAYENSVPCEPATVTEEEGEVKAKVENLQPDTTYFYRVRAVNSSGVPSAGEGAEDQGEVKTTGPGEHGESVTEVASTAATLQATIEPDGSPTSYYFQYSTTSTAGCEATGSSSSCPELPAPPGEEVGSTGPDQHLSQRLQGLSPATTYHYRVVLISEPKPGKTEVFPERDQTFTTQSEKEIVSLSDGRQWELVSPPDKHGALLAEIREGWVIQASLSGNAFTYLGSNPTEDGAPGYLDHEQILSTHGPTGWTSQDISLPHSQAAPISLSEGEEYRFFSEDLSLGLAEPFGEFTSLTPFVFPADTERTPYIRHDRTCSSEPGSCFEPLVTGTSGYADVPEHTMFGGTPNFPRGDVTFVGATPDASHVVIRSAAALKTGAPEGALYEWSAGAPLSEELKLVSVLPEGPEGGIPVTGEVGGPADTGATARWAVSADGSRVVWSSGSGLYLTDVKSGRSVRLDVPEAQCLAKKECGGGEAAPDFQIASSDGSRVFFSDPQRLMAGAGPGGLYECEVAVDASGPTCGLRDVAPGATLLGGVLSASEDGSYMYFVSNTVVGDGAERGAVTGGCHAGYADRPDQEGAASASCNLYSAHYDASAHSWEAPVLIGVLSGEDFPDWSNEVYSQTARASSNGGWLAFMSDRPLTGYDNRDAFSGKPDEEVFLYDTTHGRLICASCNPTGARPQGVEVGEGGRSSRLVTGSGGGLSVWRESAQLAANVPGWTPYSARVARHQSRYLSDEGRLFFNSSDALVPQDTNNQEDVYEWEPAGVGSCSPGSAGFSASTGACVSLVSSGVASGESAFLDASASGNDVFFLTGERLVAEDTDTALDVYDAHVCSEAVPCISKAAPPASCVTADACRAAATPEPSIFGAPASETFSGPGNPPLPSPPAKVLTNAEKLAKALKICRKDRVKRRRVACERTARRRYPIKRARKAARRARVATARATNTAAATHSKPVPTVSVASKPAASPAVKAEAARTPAGAAGVRPAALASELPSAWWNLSVSERPTSLRSGVAHDELQRVTVTATGGEFLLGSKAELNLELGTGFALFKWDATKEELQAGLEGVYGKGNVRVLKGQGNASGSEPYEIEFLGARGSQQVEPIFGSPNVTSENIAPSFRGKENLQGSVTSNAVELVTGVPDGQVVVSAVNVGNTEATGPVGISVKLPAGLRAVKINAAEGPSEADEREKPSCVLSSLSCSYEAGVPAFEGIEVYVSVVVEPGAKSGEVASASVSGGGAVGTKTESNTITVGEADRFGIEAYRLVPENVGGTVDTQAGSHPFQVTSVYTANSQGPNFEGKPRTVGLPRDIVAELPAGFVGNPTPFEQCTDVQFANVAPHAEEHAINECPTASAMGVAVVTFAGPGSVGFVTEALPIFNMVPLPGEPARFAFKPKGVASVLLDTSVRTGSDYGVDVTLHTITQSAWVLSARLTFWGVPGDKRHHEQRGWECLQRFGVCPLLTTATPPPFLVMPTSCEAPFVSRISADSWPYERHASESAERTFELPKRVDGCNHLQFDPSIEAKPDVSDGSTSTGLLTDVHVSQAAALAPEGLAESSVRDIEVALPEGMAVNPSGADGLAGCSEGEIGFTGETGGVDQFTSGLDGPFCPDAAKVGTVRIKTPLLPNPLTGAVYLASQNENPFGSLVAMYIVAREPVSGTLVKLPGEVQLGATGQLVAHVRNSPELPFEDAELHFFGGERAPLATPARCGSYVTNAVFTPWSGNPPVASSSTFQITLGPNGSPCPGASLPFAPSLAAGTSSVQAGAFTPLMTTISRRDGEQALQGIVIHTPPGLAGLISHVVLCGEARADAGTCGPESLIGETSVSVGVGGHPYTVTGGRVYVTGPYHGAPFGLSVVNPAKAGPFDLEKNTPCDCVVVRARIEVDPHTAALTVATDDTGPYRTPTVIDGIPLEIQHVNVTVNRPEFSFNPTSCGPLAITATIASTEGASFPAQVPFQDTNCRALGFKPGFQASVSGRTSKANGASLTVKVTYPKAPFGSQANIAQTRVELPKQLPSRLTTLQKACLATQFNANPARCPAASIVGHAKATTPLLPVPLEGPAYFVSNGSQAFPNLIVVLQGDNVTVDLVGDTFISKAGITSSTFKTIPDSPVGSFELTLPQGPYSALTANLNLCRPHTKLAMPTTIIAQDNSQIRQNTPITITGCARHRHHNKVKKAALHTHKKK